MEQRIEFALRAMRTLNFRALCQSMEAATIFGDPSLLTIPNPEHPLAEERYVTIGRAFAGKLLVVVHTDRGNNIRIISARAASRRERKFYEKDT